MSKPSEDAKVEVQERVKMPWTTWGNTMEQAIVRETLSSNAWGLSWAWGFATRWDTNAPYLAHGTCIDTSRHLLLKSYILETFLLCLEGCLPSTKCLSLEHTD